MSKSHWQEHLQQQAEQAKKHEELYKQTLHSLETEERFINFFKGYNQQSVKNFINYYATLKTSWYRDGDSLYNYSKSRDNRWRDECTKWLKAILYKKLFDVKCRWIAGEMDIEGIEISNDITTYYEQPHLAPFITPITAREYDCLISYIQNEWVNREINNDEDEERSDAQSYVAMEYFHSHRALYVSGNRNMVPEWYNYFDKFFGNPSLVDLPLIRMEIETDWQDVWSNEIYAPSLSPEQRKTLFTLTRLQRKELHENPEKEKQYWDERNRMYEEEAKTKPKYEHYHAHGEFLDKVVNAIEDDEIKKKYRAYTDWFAIKEFNEEIDMDIIILSEAEELVPIKPHKDYREAIANASEEYQHKKMMETFPYVFNEYLQCINDNKPFNWDKTNRYTNFRRGADESKKRILAARKLKGEPENFDFLKKNNLLKN